ncbi:MAG: intradiol ring-cleavage dioxygenase [Saprospiraceae bacterium]
MTIQHFVTLIKSSIEKIIKTGFLFFMISCHGQINNTPVNQQDINNTPPEYYGIPQNIISRDTSPAWAQAGQKLLLTGIVYEYDGKTPAAGIIIYYYHTNIHGKYLHKATEKGSLPPNKNGQTHGYIRGWVKTDSNGKYSIYTVRPGAYPTDEVPAHIHLTIQDPKTAKPYYIDDVVFDDDRLLTAEIRKKMENRGGSGVVRMVQKADLYIAERNIILGLNIPDYPTIKTSNVNSGINIGEDIMSFTPFHAWGPDKGTKTCPICKYGWYHGILYFVGNKPNWAEIKDWLTFLEAESVNRTDYLKVYFIYGNELEYDKADREKTLAKIGQTLHLNKVALTFVPAFSDKDSDIYLSKINPETENTLLIYKRSQVIDKYINLKPIQENFNLISRRLDESINEYFVLPKAKHE